jgi:hypothetical protein
MSLLSVFEEHCSHYAIGKVHKPFEYLLRILSIVNSGQEEGWDRRIAKARELGKVSRPFPRCKKPELTAADNPK